jgi:hypothetical protein
VVAKAIALATRVACNKEGNGNSSKSAGNKGGGQAKATRAMVTGMLTTWVMATATRLAGNKEGKGKGSKGNGNGGEGGGLQEGKGGKATIGK